MTNGNISDGTAHREMFGRAVRRVVRRSVPGENTLETSGAQPSSRTGPAGHRRGGRDRGGRGGGASAWWIFLVANSNSSNYCSWSLSHSLTHSVPHCDMIVCLCKQITVGPIVSCE